jgi:hypothetical protein
MNVTRLSMLVLLLALNACRATSPAKPNAGVLEDSLTSGKSTLAKSIIGGRFDADGWTAVDDTDHIYYELPAGVRSASLEFEVKGTVVGAPKDPRKHIFLVSDRYLGPSAKYGSANSTVITLRVWSSDRGPSKAGKTRLRTVGLAYKEGDQGDQGDKTGGKYQKDSDVLTWDPNQWYRMRIRWTQDQAVFERDGVVISSVKFPNKSVEFRHLLLNSGNYGLDMHGLLSVSYRNLKVSTDQTPLTAVLQP